MNFFEVLSGVLIALIIKDFYDIFIRSYIVSVLSNYRILITKTKNEVRKK